MPGAVGAGEVQSTAPVPPRRQTTKGSTMKLYLHSAAEVALLLAAAVAETVEARKQRAAR